MWCEQKESRVKDLIENGQGSKIEGYLTRKEHTFVDQLFLTVGQYHRVDAGEIRVESLLALLEQDCEKYKEFVVWALLLERATVNRFINTLSAQNVIRQLEDYQTETIEV